MNKYNIILFDLDGTLTDPGIGITNSVAFSLSRFEINISDRQELFKFIGPPLVDSFKEYYGLDDNMAVKAVEYYREYYSQKGIFENELYGGIKKLLSNLKSAGKKVILATSKPEFFATQILKYFDIEKYFDFVAGATLDETRTNKGEVIEYAIKSCEITEKSDVVMVGDRSYDIQGAEKNGIDSVGVLFGYGSAKELEAAGATQTAASVEELYKMLL